MQKRLRLQRSFTGGQCLQHLSNWSLTCHFKGSSTTHTQGSSIEQGASPHQKRLARPSIRCNEAIPLKATWTPVENECLLWELHRDHPSTRRMKVLGMEHISGGQDYRQGYWNHDLQNPVSNASQWNKHLQLLHWTPGHGFPSLGHECTLTLQDHS